MLIEGYGGPQDLVLARDLLEQLVSRDIGNGVLAGMLGDMFYHGRGGTEDKVRARQLFEMGAGVGDSLSNFMLGVMALYGTGEPQDYIKARKFFELAADEQLDARFNLALMLERGEGGPQDLSRARALFENLVSKEFGRARAFLAYMIWQGEGGPKNEVQARSMYEELVREGDKSLIFALASMLYKGQGGQRIFHGPGICSNRELLWVTTAPDIIWLSCCVTAREARRTKFVLEPCLKNLPLKTAIKPWRILQACFGPGRAARRMKHGRRSLLSALENGRC